MAFQKDFPKEAVHALASFGDQPAELLALAGYEVLGYGLGLYFGTDVKYPAALDFATLSKLAEGADLVAKIQTRISEYRVKGVANWLLILKLLAEFGPVILQLVQAIRELLAKPTPALPE
jgi:hypothetical protein